jgi:hypothetical protein
MQLLVIWLEASGSTIDKFEIIKKYSLSCTDIAIYMLKIFGLSGISFQSIAVDILNCHIYNNMLCFMVLLSEIYNKFILLINVDCQFLNPTIL